MEKTYKFYLEKGSKKYLCPKCNRKSLVRYLSSVTSQYLPFEFGRCDREIKCSYHLSPYQDLSPVSENTLNRKVNRKRIEQLTSIPYQVLKKTQRNYEGNVFIQNLLRNIPFPFLEKDIEKVIALYQLGTISKGSRKGAITFPFIDKKDFIRAIQVKQFDNNNHTISTDFIHSMLARELHKMNKPHPVWLSNYINQDKRITCLFGEHLLSRYPSNPIALVEAPKSAIYGSLYLGFPDHPENFLWLAVYNLSSLNFEKCKVLEGRKVILFPDLSEYGKAFALWKKKANEIQNRVGNTAFTVSDLLENYATSNQKEKGLDIADYLILLDWREFRRD